MYFHPCQTECIVPAVYQLKKKIHPSRECLQYGCQSTAAHSGKLNIYVASCNI